MTFRWLQFWYLLQEVRFLRFMHRWFWHQFVAWQAVTAIIGGIQIAVGVLAGQTLGWFGIVVSMGGGILIATALCNVKTVPHDAFKKDSDH